MKLFRKWGNAIKKSARNHLLSDSREYRDHERQRILIVEITHQLNELEKLREKVMEAKRNKQPVEVSATSTITEGLPQYIRGPVPVGSKITIPPENQAKLLSNITQAMGDGQSVLDTARKRIAHLRTLRSQGEMGKVRRIVLGFRGRYRLRRYERRTRKK